MADRHVAGERLEAALVEDLGDQAEVTLGGDVPALAGRDAGRLLAAVLERVEREVGEPGDVLLRGVDAEDAALVAGPVALDRGLVRPRVRGTDAHLRVIGRTPGWPLFHESCSASADSKRLPASSKEMSILAVAGSDCDTLTAHRAERQEPTPPRCAQLQQRVARAGDDHAARSLAEQRRARVDLGAAHQRLEVERRPDAALQTRTR